MGVSGLDPTTGNIVNTKIEDCKYRHALPPGFILKQRGKKEDKDEEEHTITLEEFLETEVRLDCLYFFYARLQELINRGTNWGRH